jgi:hypothetical protein
LVLVEGLDMVLVVALVEEQEVVVDLVLVAVLVEEQVEVVV